MFRIATVMAITLTTSLAVAQVPKEIGIPQSVGVQLKEHNLDTNNVEIVKQTGFKYVRRGFIWSGVEKQPGEYDFTRYDKLVTDCRDRGLTLIATIALGNDKLYGHVKDDKGREAYAKYAAVCADRYKNEKHIIWEIWNEPNTMTFWGRHGGVGNSDRYADEYTKLVNAAVPLMKKADPDCIILGGSVSNLWSKSYEWQEYTFKRDILKSGIDYWSVHPYGLKCPEEYIEAYGIVRDLMKTHGGRVMPMINSERGFTVTGKGEGDAGGDPARRLEYQAWHFVRQQLIDLYCDIKVTIWYEWSGNEGFSLHNANEDIPALKAAKVMLTQLDGYVLEKRIDLNADRDFAMQFKNKAGNIKIVAWTAPPPKESPDKTVVHEVAIPVSAKGTLETATIYGEPGKVDVADGKITLTLSGAPQYVKVK